MTRVLLLITAAASALCAVLLLFTSPQVDYGAFTASCPRVAGPGATASDDGVPGGVEIVDGREDFRTLQADERNLGETGNGTIGHRVAAVRGDRRRVWALGAGASLLVCATAGAWLVVLRRGRRAEDRQPAPVG